jgi:5-deoxy-glucuronate isomerase
MGPSFPWRPRAADALDNPRAASVACVLMERSEGDSTPAAGTEAPRLHLRAGTAPGPAGDLLAVSPESAGWRFAGLRVLRLDPGTARVLDTGPDEALVLPLSGACDVRCGAERIVLEGRDSVFDRVSDFAYVPRGTVFEISSRGGGEFAVPTARARRTLAPAYGPAGKVPVEVRGAGAATRQVTNFCAPAAFETDRLTCVEVLTPAGNWSSYPPHKHDEEGPAEAVLEEIYYFRIAGPAGYGIHKTYTADGTVDETVTVRDGDAFLVPRGYHGPCVATPNHDMYYLNVLAGPAAERSLSFCDDPAHHWVRDTWTRLDPDPRVPLTTASGPRAPASPWR